MPDRPVLPSCHIWRAVLPCDGVTADRPALPSCHVWQAVLPCVYGGPSRHAVLPFMAGRLAMDVGMADHPVLPSCHMAGGGRGVHGMRPTHLMTGQLVASASRTQICLIQLGLLARQKLKPWMMHLKGRRVLRQLVRRAYMLQICLIRCCGSTLSPACTRGTTPSLSKTCSDESKNGAEL